MNRLVVVLEPQGACSSLLFDNGRAIPLPAIISPLMRSFSMKSESLSLPSPPPLPLLSCLFRYLLCVCEVRGGVKEWYFTLQRVKFEQKYFYYHTLKVQSVAK